MEKKPELVQISSTWNTREGAHWRAIGGWPTADKV